MYKHILNLQQKLALELGVIEEDDSRCGSLLEPQRFGTLLAPYYVTVLMLTEPAPVPAPAPALPPHSVIA